MYTGSTDIKKHMTSNLATVAVVPMTTDVPLSHFTRELCSAINAIGEACTHTHTHTHVCVCTTDLEMLFSSL